MALRVDDFGHARQGDLLATHGNVHIAVLRGGVWLSLRMIDDAVIADRRSVLVLFDERVLQCQFDVCQRGRCPQCEQSAATARNVLTFILSSLVRTRWIVRPLFVYWRRKRHWMTLSEVTGPRALWRD